MDVDVLTLVLLDVLEILHYPVIAIYDYFASECSQWYF